MDTEKARQITQESIHVTEIQRLAYVLKEARAEIARLQRQVATGEELAEMLRHIFLFVSEEGSLTIHRASGWELRYDLAKAAWDAAKEGA